MNIETIYKHLIDNSDRIEGEITDRLTNHPITDSSNALRAAVANRWNTARCERLKTSVLDDDGLECLLYIQFFGMAHNRFGVPWSESTLETWLEAGL